MDCDGDHFMNTEYCFFDRKRKRCRGFVTLSASVYHPLLRKQITLATMEAESENHTNVTFFGDILNECLRKVPRKTNYKFNPVGWCADMARANLAVLSEVFGETVTDRIKTSEFYFKDHRNKNARELDPDSAVEFKTLCDNLLLSATEGAYERAKAEMGTKKKKKNWEQKCYPPHGTLAFLLCFRVFQISAVIHFLSCRT